jgi:hypothetical protein
VQLQLTIRPTLSSTATERKPGAQPGAHRGNVDGSPTAPANRFARAEQRTRRIIAETHWRIAPCGSCSISFAVEAANQAAKKDGFKAIRQILEEQKPEAAYFLADGGKRTGILVINMDYG